MAISAIAAPRRLQRLHEIHVQACRLVLERSFAGFTMDDLAEAVGCSRRTLFNYVPDKASAVLGAWDDDLLAHPAMTDFLAGGPTGGLFDDASLAIRRVLETAADDATDNCVDPFESQRLLSQVVRNDSKVMHLALQRMELLTRTLADAIVRRESWPERDLRALTLAAHLFGLLAVALHLLEERGADPHRSGEPIGLLFQQAIDADHQAQRWRRPAG